MKKLIMLSFALGAILSLLFSAIPANASTFNPNVIMDDYVFDNSESMTAAQINAFLNSFPGSCISPNNGFSAPLPNGYSPSTGFTYGANATAGEIIATASSVYGLNPQVMLATLQKEQSLVSGSVGCRYYPDPSAPFSNDPGPNNTFTCNINGTNQTCTYACLDAYGGGCINIAVGYDCPLYCKASSEGFSKQVIRAAWKLKFVQQRSLGNYNWNIQKPGWDNSDDPATSYDGRMTAGNRKRNATSTLTYYDGLYSICESNGSGCNTTLMGTGATASLYSYTPFFTGNRSFEDKFETWFGSPFTPSYSWQLTGQYAFSDNTKTTPIGLNNLTPGQRVFIGYTVKNTGNQTWTNTGPNAVNAATVRPIARNSAFFDPTWLSPSRPATMKEATVAPGETATFEFWITAPTGQATNFNEYFGLVREGIAWFPDIGMYFGATVQKVSYAWQLTGQYAFTDQTKATPTGLGNLSPGQKVFVGITAKNTGNTTWSKTGPNPVFLGTSNERNRVSAFMNNSGWQSPIRAALMQEATVAPGQTATFEFWMTAPNSLGGNFREYFNIVSEGRAWMDDLGMNFSGSLINPKYTWSLEYQYAFTDSSKTTPTGLSNLTPGQTALLGIKIKNTGNVTWYKTGNFPVNLGTTRATERASQFYTPGWPGYARPSNMLETAVAPGQTATFEFMITAPATKTRYLEYFTPVVETLFWMQDIGLNFNLLVV